MNKANRTKEKTYKCHYPRSNLSSAKIIELTIISEEEQEEDDKDVKEGGLYYYFLIDLQK